MVPSKTSINAMITTELLALKLIVKLGHIEKSAFICQKGVEWVRSK
jgi:hypothetical protein